MSLASTRYVIELRSDHRPVGLYLHAFEHEDEAGSDAGTLWNRRNREAGGGLTAIITTPGWRDETGALWTPGNKVWVSSPFLDISQDMLIETIDYVQDGTDEGTRCVLNLVDPRAHGGAAGKVNKSGSSWDMDDSDAQDGSADV